MNYRWEITPEIQNLLIKLEACKISLDQSKKQPHLEKLLRTQSLLRSAVYSARIEGFPDEEDSPKKASQNLLRVYEKIHDQKLNFDLPTIKSLHLELMKNLGANGGSYRQEPWAIFDQSGSAIYLAPMHFEVPKLMDEYFGYISSLKDHPAVIAAIAQFILEKIHPFADGNGRVGRLASTLLLVRQSYGFRGLIPFERYIENHRSAYYHALEPNQDITLFITFFLTALVDEINQILNSLQSSKSNLEDSLMPRRQEIIRIIRDHPLCSFNMLHRRFFSVNPKTLHYDLSQLIKGGYITKVGTTRGVLYKV